MGKIISQLTGTDQAAHEARAQAAEQSTAIAASAEKAKQSALESAAQAARQMELSSARQKAEGEARDTASKPLESADVQLSLKTDEAAATSAKRKRASFGVGYDSGVKI